MQERWFFVAGVALVMVVTFIFLTACNSAPPTATELQGNSETAEINEIDNQISDSISETPQVISNMRAREIAEGQVGRGTAGNVSLFYEDGVMTFEVEVVYGGTRYAVFINAESGAVIRLNQYSGLEPPSEPEPIVTSTPQPTPSPAPSPSPSPTPSPSPSPAPSPTPSPAPSPSPGGQVGRPVNPAISLERAIEIGYGELSIRGYSGTFSRHSGMDFERGQWVWELLFRVQGGRLPFVEMYINVDTGAVVKFEWDD